jgi:hypothetical protein
MKSFNLEKALAGEPVETYDGRPVKIAGYNPDAFNGNELLGWIGGQIAYWDQNGIRRERYLLNTDLFMAEKSKTKYSGWINIYKSNIYKTNRMNRSTGGRIHATKEEALNYNNSDIIDTIEIHWEEYGSIDKYISELNTLWINLYQSSYDPTRIFSTTHLSEEEAKKASSSKEFIKTIKIEV